MVNLMYLLFAILGLSFLIFIHELGHYFMARRVGMRVETFSIGFGRPIFSWRMDGVSWQIGWLPFGGYVRIAGMESDKEDPYQVRDGFFGKSPWDRIKVAFMGPFVNLLFALLVFALLWVGGGRVKSFSEFTAKVGWVDLKSEAYQSGLRPGDEIVSYNGNTFQAPKDHLYAGLTSGPTVDIKGNKINYANGKKSAFEIHVKPIQHPASMEKGILTTGVTQPASYLIYDKFSGQENPLPKNSPMEHSGLQYGDRIVWVDGQQLFSMNQLAHQLNDDRALLTIQRGSQTLLARALNVPMQEFRMDPALKEELVDWQYEAGLNGIKFQNLRMIPYNLTNDGVVINRIKFIEKENEKEAFPDSPMSNLEMNLQIGDRIIAVNGIPVNRSLEIFKQLQNKLAWIIVERSPELNRVSSWKNAEYAFETSINTQDLEKIASSIGTGHLIRKAGNLYLLDPVSPKTRQELMEEDEKMSALVADLQNYQNEIERIEDPEKKAQLLASFSSKQNQLMLGIPGLQDKKIQYNPIPTDLFSNVFQEIWRTLSALFTGTLNPKWMSGPIGIIQVIQEQWKLSFSEVLYLLGAISLNLGILNLLPIPMLDGGAIMLAFFEMVTRRKIKPKTMEKLVLPFAVLLIVFFIFLTFNDLSRISELKRIFGGFFRW